LKNEETFLVKIWSGEKIWDSNIRGGSKNEKQKENVFPLKN
jgi:hypothetical protein